jgi:hypothetical protein
VLERPGWPDAVFASAPSEFEQQHGLADARLADDQYDATVPAADFATDLEEVRRQVAGLPEDPWAPSSIAPV